MQTTRLAVLQTKPAHLERAFEVRDRVGLDTCRCRTARHPSPSRTAQALQCGTPGHGSGRRRRKTPGSTRSPRPSSRFGSARGEAFAGLRVARLDHAPETRLRTERGVRGRLRGGDAWLSRRATRAKAATKVRAGGGECTPGPQPAQEDHEDEPKPSRWRAATSRRSARATRRGRRAVGGGRARQRARPGRRAGARGRTRSSSAN